MLEIRGVSKTFNSGTINEVRSLASVDLTIEEGSWVVVIGTNGSGKSTLVNAVAGSFFVDSGAIKVAGEDITKWAECRRAKFIGRMFQNPYRGASASMSLADNSARAD